MLKTVLIHLSISPLLARIFYRKLQLYVLCEIGKKRMKEVDTLLRYIGFPIRARCKKEFTGIQRAFFAGMGYPTENGKRIGSICWNSPIGITVLLHDKECFGLGIELYGSVLAIRQMQGARGAKIPETLKDWPTLLIEACRNYAEDAKLKEVRVYKADQDLQFKNPFVILRDGQRRKEAVLEHQNRMRRRYDRAASDLGFEKRKRYYVWYPNKAQPN
jgi:hypothetical protein